MNRDDNMYRGTGTGTMDAVDTSNLTPLSRLDDFKIASGGSDVRGWQVVANNGQRLGKVQDLLVDTSSQSVLYLVVSLDGNLAGSGQRGQVLLPVDSVRLSERDEKVLVDSADLSALSTYDLSSYDRERSGMTGMGRTEDEARLTLSEEELRVGKRQVAAGEVGVRKHVETERVQQSVPVLREEVTVERRPATGMGTEASIGEDEIRVPLMQEEVVTEKRVVPKEELVIKKHQVQGEQVVEDTVRRERAEVNRMGETGVVETDLDQDQLNERNRRR